MMKRCSRVTVSAIVLAIFSSSGNAFTSPTTIFLTQHQKYSRRNPFTQSFLHFLGNKGNDEDPMFSSEEQNQVKETNFLAEHMPTIKVALPSFVLGGIATLSFLFLPILTDYYDAFSGAASTTSFYSTTSETKLAKNNINQPVILFETILNDLNEAYVDDVDIQKLFETGVKAMTSSLDPYTEFESRQEAQDLEESVSGQYGGVGLVIRGSTLTAEAEDIALDPMPAEEVKDKPPIVKNADDDDRAAIKRRKQKTIEDGIRVVSAFEGYAYDAGIRVGDKLLAVDDFQIKPTTTVDQVRNHLRGQPGTPVAITFQREGVGGVKSEPQTIMMQRSVVHIPDVKYYGFVGDPKDAIGYIDLSGFANDAGREVRYAIRVLQHGAEMIAKANGGEIHDEEGRVTADSIDTTKLKVRHPCLNHSNDSIMIMTPLPLIWHINKGLILDLRSNPGGLLTSAVDVSTLFVPNGSDIVSAKGRGFPETLYRSKTEPILNSNTRLAVLVNEQTASAAEIVTGAVQDLDVGVVVGKGRTFGKGLVQNVQDLPYQTALKYTVAKYYTPSGRCIQSTVYEEGGRGSNVLGASSEEDTTSKPYKSKKVADKDRSVFLTAHGREGE